MHKFTITALFFLLSVAVAIADEAVNEDRPMNPKGRLELEAVTGQFQIIGSNSDRLVINGTLGSDIRELEIEESNGNWRVTLKPVNRRGWSGRQTTSSRLTLQVPREAEVEANTVSGSLSVQQLSGRQVYLRTVSGAVELDSVTPERVVVHTVSGPQKINSGGSRSNLLHSISGNINAENLGGQININTVTGATNLQGTKAVEQLLIETVSGQVSASLIPAPEGRFRISSHSGNLELSLPEGTPLSLRANTFSGSIDSVFGGEPTRGNRPGEQLNLRLGDGSTDVELRSFSGNIRLRHRN